MKYILSQDIIFHIHNLRHQSSSFLPRVIFGIIVKLLIWNSIASSRGVHRSVRPVGMRVVEWTTAMTGRVHAAQGDWSRFSIQVLHRIVHPASCGLSEGVNVED